MAYFFKVNIMRWYTALLYLLFCAHTIGAQTDEQFVFNNACELYNAGRYQDAMLLFESIAQPTPAIFYNIGMCFYKMEDFGHALQALWRADRSATAEQKKMNEQARLKVRAHIDDAPLPHDSVSSVQRMSQAFWQFIDRVPLLYLQLIMLLIVGVLIAVACCYIHIPSVIMRVILLFLLTLMMLLMALLVYQRYSRRHCRRGIVLTQTPVRIGPNQHYHSPQEIPVGTLVMVEKKVPGWYKIHHHQYRGWVERSQVGTI
jgi:uncharacterized membrane protein YraQ (UPF0718 family)